MKLSYSKVVFFVQDFNLKVSIIGLVQLSIISFF